MKHSDNSTHPQLRLDNSFFVMNEQGEKKIQQIISNVITSSQTQCDLNINDNVYDQLTRVGVEILRNLCIRSKYHTCARVQYNEWKSTCPKDLYEDSNKLKIPQWKTVETVTVTTANWLKFSCSYTNV